MHLRPGMPEWAGAVGLMVFVVGLWEKRKTDVKWIGRMRWTNEKAAFWKTPSLRVRLGSPAHFHSPPPPPTPPPPPPPPTMSLLTSILGFSAFGFGARCLQLGLQKRPIFEGKPRRPHRADPPAFHGHAYAAIGFGVLGAGAYHVDQKQCVPAGVRGGELTGAAGRRCSQRRRRPCSSNGRLRTGNGLRARGKRMPCSSLGCSVYQLAPAFSHLAAQLQLQLAAQLQLITHNSHS